MKFKSKLFSKIEDKAEFPHIFQEMIDHKKPF